MTRSSSTSDQTGYDSLPWRDELLIKSVGFLGGGLLRLVSATLRWHTAGLIREPGFWAREPRAIFAFWHDRQLFVPFTKLGVDDSKTPIAGLTSQHRDGRFIAETLGYVGVGAIGGSSSRGGTAAIRMMCRALQAGSHIAISPDGPKGPRWECKMGVVALARISGRPVYPMTYSAERYWKFKSWDRMMFPKPFSRAVRIIGEPVTVPRDCPEDLMEEYRLKIERSVSELTRMADDYKYDSAAV